MGMSVLHDWISDLPLQQQAVLILALRGPDGDVKHTKFKVLLRCYRACVLKAAYFGRPLKLGEAADTFMSLGDEFLAFRDWRVHVGDFLEDEADAAILHHYTHFMHGAEILAYKHPILAVRERWQYCYERFCHRLHVNPESPIQMDERLNDWGREHWDVA
jgi:hypothetical protein